MLPSNYDNLRALCGRSSESELVPLRGVRFSNGDEPACNECRQNVAKWVEENPECTPAGDG